MNRFEIVCEIANLIKVLTIYFDTFHRMPCYRYPQLVITKSKRNDKFSLRKQICTLYVHI